MSKLFVLAGVALTALLVLTSPAAASSTTCNSTLTAATIPDDLVVPENASCTIIGSTVGDDVRVGKNAYFESDNSDIGDDVEASRAQTVFIHNGSTVGGDVKTSRTVQVFLFDSTIGGDAEVRGSTEQIYVCGMTADDILVKESARDILVGDPLAAGCAGNTVSDDIEVERNRVDVELVVRGNTVADDLEVNRNKNKDGVPAEKFVEDNAGGDELECEGNDEPFTAGGNTGWEETEGQCEIPPVECNSGDTPVVVTTEGDLVVPDNGICVITGSTIGGNVYVGRNAYFEASSSTIGGDVKGNRSLTIFLHTGTTVGGDVETSKTFQVFLFDSTFNEDVTVSRSTEQVYVCGSDVTEDVEVTSSGRDILVGDPDSGACDGNTVGEDIEVEKNNVDVELIVRGNTVGDDLEVNHNRGTPDAPKAVQNNTGGGTLECKGNNDPFVGAPNAGFTRVEGNQCALI